MITREQLLQILLDWQSGEMNELAVWQWGEEAKQKIRAEFGGSGSGSAPPVDDLLRDIVDLLAALPYEMLVQEDIGVLKDALANPLDETDLSVNLLWNHMDAIDVDLRRDEYASHPFYGQFNEAD